MLTRDQEYSIKAHKDVTNIKDKPDAKAYGTMSHKLPILIYKNGLSQALAFVDARGKDIQSKVLLENLAQTVAKVNKEKFLSRVREAELKEYILLTRQTLDALLWYKRFAQSILHVEPGDQDEEGE